MAYEVGRHIIGYEVQKVLAGVDWFTRENRDKQMVPIGAFGYGEGGLLALYSGALDSRIQATGVSGYFQSRQHVWQEPVYRDVWGLLAEFGDAELAGLIAPRALIVEASRGPAITGPPAETEVRKGATPNGKLIPRLCFGEGRSRAGTPALCRFEGQGEAPISGERWGERTGRFGSNTDWFPGITWNQDKFTASRWPSSNLRANYDGTERLHRQFDQLVNYTQWLLGEAPKKRAAFWSKADASSPERWKQTTQFHRDYIWDEVIGRLPSPISRQPADPADL